MASVDLPAPDRPVNQSTPPRWPLRRSRVLGADAWSRGDMLVDRHARPRALVGIALHVDDAAADDVEAVDQHETAGARIAAYSSSASRLALRRMTSATSLWRPSVAGLAGQPIGVEDALDRLDGHRGGLGRDASAGRSRRPAAGVRRARTAAPGTRWSASAHAVVAGDVAALDENLLVERDADRSAGLRLDGRRAGRARPRCVRTRAVLLLGENTSWSPTLSEPDLDAADEDAAVVELVDVLDRQPQRQIDLAPAGGRRASASSSVGPAYQGMAAERAARLSPSRARRPARRRPAVSADARRDSRRSRRATSPNRASPNSRPGPSC